MGKWNERKGERQDWVFDERTWVVCLHGKVPFCSPSGLVWGWSFSLCATPFSPRRLWWSSKLALGFNGKHTHTHTHSNTHSFLATPVEVKYCTGCKKLYEKVNGAVKRAWLFSVYDKNRHDVRDPVCAWDSNFTIWYASALRNCSPLNGHWLTCLRNDDAWWL